MSESNENELRTVVECLACSLRERANAEVLALGKGPDFTGLLVSLPDEAGAVVIGLFVSSNLLGMIALPSEEIEGLITRLRIAQDTPARPLSIEGLKARLRTARDAPVRPSSIVSSS